MVGIDLININRIEKLKEKKHFYDKFFTEIEMMYIESKYYRNKHIAGIIACKEAVSKSFGVGISQQLGLKDIEILHNDKGAPYINTKLEKISKLIFQYNVEKVSVSISHDGDYAIAIAMLLYR